uniref:Unkown protein n=1 Tax=Riptortus pedestris TaxID=329032 RepID=R4WTM0_RIPPE|nr:unkown protein [Riptortus pedestris]
MPSLRSDFKEKLLSYVPFLNDMLKDDMEKLRSKLEDLQEEVFDYNRLKNYFEALKKHILEEETLNTQVDVRRKSSFQGMMINTNKILVSIGLDYYVALSLDEALPVIDKRIHRLEKEIAFYMNGVAVTRSHLTLVLRRLIALENLKKFLLETFSVTSKTTSNCFYYV